MVRIVALVMLMIVGDPALARNRIVAHPVAQRPAVRLSYISVYAASRPYQRYGYYHGDFQMGGNQENF